jgi:hypothetical protein
VILKEEPRWKDFGRLLTNIFGPKKEEGSGGFETLRNAALRNLFLRINPLNAELNPSCHLLALLGGATIVDVSRLRVNYWRVKPTRKASRMAETSNEY